MGIPKFKGKWLDRRAREDQRFRGVVLRRLRGPVTSLSLDMNGIIHNGLAVATGSRDYYDPVYREEFLKLKEGFRLQRMFDAITSNVVEIVNKVSPSDIIIIAVDGVVNHAKLHQQRGRRYKTSVSGDPEETKMFYESSMVTPGTDFMIKFDEYFAKWIEKNRIFFPPSVIYSSHLVPGEGEHKIMSYYRSGKFPHKGQHVLYGLDADLIMLSMLVPVNNIFLIREDFNKVINIERLKAALRDSAPEPCKETSIQDFVALTYLLGNDFIPHGPTHNSTYSLVEGLLGSYNKTSKPLTRKLKSGINSIDFTVLADILEDYGTDQYDLLAEEATEYYNIKREKNIDKLTVPELIAKEEVYNRFFEVSIVEEELVLPTGKIKRKAFDPDRFRSGWYTNELGIKGNNPFKFPDPTVSDIEDMCNKYIEGIAWSFRYYQNKHTDTEWSYPYYHAPMIEDLAVVLRSKDDTLGEALNRKFTVKFEMSYGPIEQLLAVIPIASRMSGVPSMFHALMTDEESPITPYFPYGFVIEKDGIPADENFLATPIVPGFNMSMIIKAIESMAIPEEVMKRWSPAVDISVPASKSEIKTYNTRTSINREISDDREKRHDERLAERGGRGNRGRGGNRGFKKTHNDEGRERTEGFKRPRGNGRGDARGRGNIGGRGDKRNQYNRSENPRLVEGPVPRYFNTNAAPGEKKYQDRRKTGEVVVAGGTIDRDFEFLTKTLGDQFSYTQKYRADNPNQTNVDMKVTTQGDKKMEKQETVEPLKNLM